MELRSESAIVRSPEQVEVTSVAVPSIGDDEALLEVELGGVCGSDPKTYRGKYRPDATPLILGHEILGRIAEIGETAAASMGVERGDRVVVEAQRPCGSCSHCLNGEYHFCDEHSSYGFTPLDVASGLWGAHGGYMILKENTIAHRISENVPAEAAVLACAVVGNSVRWVQSAGTELVGRSIVIQGPGPQGLSMAIIAQNAGLSPIVVAGVPRDEDRLKMAERLGADHVVCRQPENIVEEVRDLLDGGADVVANLTGVAQSAQQSIDLVTTNGTILFPSVSGGEASTLELDELVHRNVRLQGVFSRTAEYVKRSIALIEREPKPFAQLVSHRYPIAEAETAYRVAGGMDASETPLKVAIDPSL